jgi:hypothetical protein
MLRVQEKKENASLKSMLEKSLGRGGCLKQTGAAWGVSVPRALLLTNTVAKCKEGAREPGVVAGSIL